MIAGCVGGKLPVRVNDPADNQQERFVDVSTAMGLEYPTFSGGTRKHHIRESLGQGVCWIDYDADGDLDLFLPNGATEVRGSYHVDKHLLRPWQFYVNEEGRLRQAAEQVGLAVSAWGIGCAVGDVDNDGFDDLFVTTAASENRLFHNRGDGTFEDWTMRSGVGNQQLSSSAAFGDLDGDGDLDLVVATYLVESPAPVGDCYWKGVTVMCGPKGFQPCDDLLYLNDGTGRFTETDKLQGHPGYGLGVLLFDADGDNDTDVFIANDSSPNHLFLNDGRAEFTESGTLAGVALSNNGASQAGMGVDAGDLDGDGNLDLVVTNFSDDVHNFYRNNGSGLFSDWSTRSGMAQATFAMLGWSTLLEDFDLDGDLDVFVANGHVYPQISQTGSGERYLQTMQLLVNDGLGHLVDASADFGSVFSLRLAGRGASSADLDDDGDLDLLVTRDQAPPLLLKNNASACQDLHWLKIQLQGRRSNREGIGARIELCAEGKTQVREVRRSRGYLSAGPSEVVFGLGSISTVDEIKIIWPSGISQTLVQVSVDEKLTVQEP